MILDKFDESYYCTTIDDEKILKIVIKDDPEFIDTKEIELKTKYTQSKKSTECTGKRKKSQSIFQSILVLTITEKNKEIYNISIQQDLQVWIELKRTPETVP